MLSKFLYTSTAIDKTLFVAIMLFFFHPAEVFPALLLRHKFLSLFGNSNWKLLPSGLLRFITWDKESFFLSRPNKKIQLKSREKLQFAHGTIGNNRAFNMRLFPFSVQGFQFVREKKSSLKKREPKRNR